MSTISETWNVVGLEALDVLSFSDPRGLQDGGWAHPGSPSPLSIAGALRTAVLQGAGFDFTKPLDAQTEGASKAAGLVGFPGAEVPEKQLRIAAPFFFGWDSLFVPAPAGAFWSGNPWNEKSITLKPEKDPAQSKWIFDEEIDGLEVMSCAEDLEPDRRYYRLGQVCSMLASAAGNGDQGADVRDLENAFEALSDFDIEDPIPSREFFSSEPRTGHARDSSGVPLEGGLFTRPCIRFTDTGKKPTALAALLSRRVNLADGGLLPLGGDGYTVRLRQFTEEKALLAPVDLLRSIVEHHANDLGGIVLYLLTPAVFEKGWRPPEFKGLELVAAAVRGWEIIGGWDLAAGAPRPLSRAAPAGSSYFFRIKDEFSIKDFLGDYHMGTGRLSWKYHGLGFGASLVGLWDAGGFPEPSGVSVHGRRSSDRPGTSATRTTKEAQCHGRKVGTSSFIIV